MRRSTLRQSAGAPAPTVAPTEEPSSISVEAHHPLDFSHIMRDPLQPSTIIGVALLAAGFWWELPLVIGAGLAAVGIKDAYGKIEF